MAKQTVSMRLDERIWKAVQSQAKAREVTASAWVSEALTETLRGVGQRIVIGTQAGLSDATGCESKEL